MRTLIFLIACQLVSVSLTDASQERHKLKEIIFELRNLSSKFNIKAAPIARNMIFNPTCNCSLQAMRRLAEILPGIDADAEDKKRVDMIVKNLKSLSLPKEVKSCILERKRRSRQPRKTPEAPYLTNLQSFFRNNSCSF